MSWSDAQQVISTDHCLCLQYAPQILNSAHLAHLRSVTSVTLAWLTYKRTLHCFLLSCNPWHPCPMLNSLQPSFSQPAPDAAHRRSPHPVSKTGGSKDISAPLNTAGALQHAQHQSSLDTRFYVEKLGQWAEGNWCLLKRRGQAHWSTDLKYWACLPQPSCSLFNSPGDRLGGGAALGQAA